MKITPADLCDFGDFGYRSASTLVRLERSEGGYTLFDPDRSEFLLANGRWIRKNVVAHDPLTLLIKVFHH